ncbi:MAG: TonB-dependent receptor [Paludibacteraceae bacterium]|nr:TonB-dependent receptor [Paludibacteraceae bacterium]
MGTKRSRFEYARSFVCILFLLGSVFALNARTIQGTVVDALGDPVISATVLIKGTTIGTVTDFDGNYSIDAPDDATTIVFSYVGMQTQELPISGNVINVTLKEDSEVLEEVVVTGYGTTKKRDLVTSVASVSSEQLKDMPVSTAAEAMQGKMAGVQVTTTEGSPDADVKIRVRGGTSLTQSNDPLYIVDGFPVASISDIAPSDIASMDVLKDAAATAIYGAQGANGVIIITTKDSDSDDDKMTFHFDYSGYIGWKRMAKSYDMMDARDFVLSQYEWAYLAKGKDNLKGNFNQYFDKHVERNADGTIKGDDITGVSTLLDEFANVPINDWQRRTFGPTWGQKLKDGDEVGYAQHQGFSSNHSFSVSGGNKNASFNLSYNRIDEKGIMYGSDYSRNNIAFKSKFKPFKDFTIGMTARFSNTNVLGAGANTSEDAGSKSESRVRNAIAYTPVDLVAKDNSTLDEYDSFGSLYDPITTIDHNYKAKKDNKWTLNGYASYKFLKKFTIKTELGYEGRYRDTDRFYGPTSYYSRDGEGFNKAGATGLGHVIVQDQRDTKLRNTNTFEYKDKKNNHNWSLLIGEEQQWKKGSSDYFYGYGYDAHTYTGENVFNFLGAAKATDYKNTINDADNMLSFFARANYDYAGRYYVTATFRADASTRFAKGNQWGYFPSVAAAWRMSDEEWMSGASDWLSNLKLRFSYGTAGNNNVATGYLFTTYNITPTGAAYMDNATFPTSVLYVGGSDKIAANNKLKWETTVTRDLGIDFGFFNERLTGVIDLYWNTTNDLIILYKTSMGGYNYQYRNIGSTRNRGIELTLRGVALDKKSKELSYGLTLDANISFNENIVTSLGGMANYPVSTSCFSSNYKNSDYEFMLEEGQSVGRVYGYVSDGWYTANDFASYKPDNVSGGTWYDADGKVIATVLEPNGARPGSIKLKDLNGDGVINEEDRTVIGNTLPLFTGGFNITGYVGGDKWGKVDLTANFTFSYGNDIVNMSALDYSTIFEKSKLRNLTANVAYGSRYSMFMQNGTYVPANAQVVDGVVSGENYAALAGTLNNMNSGAKVANPVTSNIALTDQYVEDGSFLRLSNLTIGYSLSPKWIEKAKMTNLRIFFQASNLFCITKYSGADPEVDTRSKINPLAIGVDYSAYPKARGFNVGLNLSF